ncbi:hypothetical protein EJB05_27942, partial [Eragrostis curvula]
MGVVVVISCRSKSNQYENTSLVQIEGVNTKEDVAWYCGKRMAYIYKAKTKSSGMGECLKQRSYAIGECFKLKSALGKGEIAARKLGNQIP